MDLLERESHLAALQEYAEEARSGSGRLVLVAGEAGIGKSSLAEEFERRLADARWAWGVCDGLSTPRPLGPLFDLAPQLDPVLERLCRQSAPRGRLFEAVLAALSGSGLLPVVVIEDAHWADDATLDMLRYLGRRARELRALVIVTFRDDELGPDSPLRDVLGLLSAQRGTRRIALAPLSPSALQILAEGTAIEPAALHDLTGGNPFFVAEVLHSVGEGADGPSRALPASVRDVVLARAGRLRESARAALDAASLIGTRMRPALLERVVAVSPRDIDDMLTCGIVRADGDLFAFRHELARRAVAEAILPHRRAGLHRDILTALTDDDQADDARLAFHAEGAGDHDATLRYALRAARHAATLGSHRESRAQYERAARYASHLEGRDRGLLFDAWADEAMLVDRGEESERARGLALDAWRALADPFREGDSLRRLSRTLERNARGAAATVAAERAVELLEPCGETPELARALATLAVNRVMNGVGGDPAARRAGMLAEVLDLPDVRSDVLYTEACELEMHAEDWQPVFEEALRVALEHDLAEQSGRIYDLLYWTLLEHVELGAAERCFTEGLAHCEAHDIGTYGWCLRANRAIALTLSGRWSDALEVAEEVLRLRASAINRYPALLAAARVRIRRGDARARELLDEAGAIAVSIGEPDQLLLTALDRVEAEWLGGDLDAARAELDAVASLAREAPPAIAGRAARWLTLLRAAPAAALNGVSLLAPYQAETEGRIDDAVREWDARGCPYDAALALAGSDGESHLREAIVRLDRLGAMAAVTAVRRRMRELGFRSVPSGSRATTRANPAGLTRREQEVLELLCESLSNEQIAARLVLSVRTVDHHVSAVLGKLGVPTRGDAVQAARLTGLVPSLGTTAS